MAEYKRWMAYLYNYENGLKRNCIGTARIERRGKEARTTVSVQIPSMSNERLKAFFYTRMTGVIRGIGIGEFNVNGTLGSWQISMNADSMDGNGLLLEHMDGLLICRDSDKYFASAWDERPLLGSEVRVILAEFERERIAELERKKIVEQELAYVEQNRMEKLADEWKKAEENITESVEDSLCEGKPASVQECMNTDEGVGEKQKDAAELIKEEEQRKAAELAKEEEQKKAAELAKEEEQKKAAELVKEEKQRKAAELVKEEEQRKAAELAKEEEQKKAAELAKEEEQKKAAELVIEEKQKRELAVERNRAIDLAAAEEQQRTLGLKVETKNFENSATRIFDQNPVIWPFSEPWAEKCVKLELEDIGLLPPKFWQLTSNSFLMHSYYGYRHLCLARRREKGNILYELLIPGIYNERENELAELFGFSSFRCAKNRPVATGEYGYWSMPVVFPD